MSKMKAQFKAAYSAARRADRKNEVRPTSVDWFLGQRDPMIRAANVAAERSLSMRLGGYRAEDRACARRAAVMAAQAGWSPWRDHHRAIVREAGAAWIA